MSRLIGVNHCLEMLMVESAEKNAWAYACPSCGSAKLRIEAKVFLILMPGEPVRLSDEEDWDCDSPVECYGCDWKGEVYELRELEDEDQTMGLHDHDAADRAADEEDNDGPLV